MKPPLRLVEQYFKSSWRKGKSVSPFIVHFPLPAAHLREQERKSWERFREIPEWIDQEASTQGISPEAVIKQLEVLQGVGDGRRLGLNALAKLVKQKRYERARNTQPTPAPSSAAPPPGSDLTLDNSDDGNSHPDPEPDPKKRQKPAEVRGRTKRVRVD